MKGLQLLKHSIRQVTGNLDGAIKISALPFAIQALAGLLLAGGAMPMAGAGMRSGEAAAGMVLGGLVASLVALVTSLWIAVAWHRYILLNERPEGFVPPFAKDRIIAYFVRTLGYAILMILAGLALFLVMSLFLAPVFNSGRVGLGMFLMAVLVQMPIVILGFRLTAGLPGTALGLGTDFMAGWKATEGATMDIAVLAGLAVTANLALALLGLFVFSAVGALFVLWSIIVSWLVTMVSISILTTLYGHYVERRQLV